MGRLLTLVVMFPASPGAYGSPATWYTLPAFPVIPLQQAWMWQNPQPLQANEETTVNPLSIRDLSNEQGKEEDPAYDTGTDIVELLDDEKARQFEEQEFDPKLKNNSSWKPQILC